MALPFLPGQVFDRKLGKEKFHKTHQFDYRNDVTSYVGEDKCGIGGDVLPGQKLKPRHSKFPAGVGAEAPAWVAFDRQVLCFDAYFQEAVQEKREEQFRVRRCKIYFYLEDDSIQVIEPKVENSGIPQGTLIRRHRIPLPPPHDEEFYTVEHFNVGKEIQLYSKTFKITDCDQFTQNFIGKLGVRVGLQAGIPRDPYTGARKEMTESMQPLRPYEKHDTLKQFLQYDGKVLRFYCLWDDTDCMFGDAREMVMHYFLADDTVEIREVIPRNAGRDAAPVFLRRQKLPKEPTPLYQPGTTTDRTVLNVFGPMGHGGRWILDSLKTGAINTECYKDSDITLGTILNIWGRPMLVCDCDEFTKEYYRSKYGVQEFKSINYKQPSEGQPSREIPPYNGFGSQEDSMANCLNLIPKPPKRDFIKFMEKDRHGLDSNIIRFMARLDTTRPIDMGRRFIISYFLSDDTILVFEPQQRNSGIVEGKFLERGRVLKPYGNSHYSARDLYIGAVVQFFKHKFLLIDADEYAITYMEKNNREFPHANMDYILPKLRKLAEENADEIRSFFGSQDSSSSGKVQYHPFRELLKKLGGDMFSEHEIVTICRHYGDKKSEEVDLNTIVASVQEKLRKANYEYFSNMSDLFRHRDKDKSGFISHREIHNVCKSFSLPVKAELVDALLQYVERNEQDLLDYSQFVRFLNWQEAPVVIQKFSPSKAADSLQPKERAGPLENLDNINYKVILQDLFLKD